MFPIVVSVDTSRIRPENVRNQFKDIKDYLQKFRLRSVMYLDQEAKNLVVYTDEYERRSILEYLECYMDLLKARPHDYLSSARSSQTT